MDFLGSIAAEVIGGLLLAGLLGLLGWVGSRLFRRYRRERAACGERGRTTEDEREAAPEPRPLRVLVALPRPIITLLREEGSELVAATDWNEATGLSRVPQLGRAWKAEAIERALRETGAPIRARFLRHATEADLRRALSEGRGYDVLLIDAHGDPDGAIGVEGPHGETHQLSPADLGRLMDGAGTRLVILSACHSAAASGTLRAAGVPTVVGMAEGVPEDAARTYLAAFLTRLAQGDRLGRAHERACGALHTRWGARPGEPDLPRLAASWRCRRRRLVRPGARGAYERLGERLPGPAPPAPTVALRGRALDQVLVQRALLGRTRPEGVSPLVTLRGFGGVGKTALACAVGHWCWERALFPGGVRFVRLADGGVVEGETLADRLLRVLDLPAPEPALEQDAYRAKVAALRSALSRDPLLLILDNFETAQPARRNCALLTELRRHCPKLHLLVTSRVAPLGVTGEHIYPLEPLTEDPAVRVFCDRAQEVGEVVRDDELGAVAAICDLLERIPLHIRLVASHVRAERPAEILAGLHDTERRHHLTQAKLSDEEAHHQSQELSFRYTYDRLSEGGRRLWAVLAAIFAGAPDRAAVRAVYGVGADAALDELLDWQVVEREDGQHRMAEAIRRFGRARMEGLDVDESILSRKHSDYFLSEQHLSGQVDVDDFLTALAWLSGQLEKRLGDFAGEHRKLLEKQLRGTVALMRLVRREE